MKIKTLEATIILMLIIVLSFPIMVLAGESKNELYQSYNKQPHAENADDRIELKTENISGSDQVDNISSETEGCEEEDGESISEAGINDTKADEEKNTEDSLHLSPDNNDYYIEDNGVFTYWSDEEGICICGLSDQYTIIENPVIPSTINGQPVVSIYGSSFTGCDCLRGKLTIPGSVKTIGTEAFKDCTEITSLEIQKGVKEISSSAFQNCAGIKGKLIIPGSVKTIGEEAFNYCTGITSLEIQKGVKEISPWAFHGCAGIKGTLTIPGSIKELDGNAFTGCTGISGLIIEYGVKEIYNFSGFTNIKGTLIIPGSVDEISRAAFKNCKGITGLEIQNGVQEISCRAFQGCKGIKGKLTIPGSVKKIRMLAFKDCTGITSLDIKNGVQEICVEEYYDEDYDDYELVGPFEGCKNIKGALTIPGSVKELDGRAFAGCTGISKLNIKNGVKCVGGFEEFTNIKGKLVLPDSINEIEADAFRYCTGITSVNIPYNVDYIGDYAFCDCTGLQKVKIEGAEEIGTGAFEGCISLKGKLVFPKTLKNIGGSAFENCVRITGLSLNDNLKSISMDAFANCTALTGSLIIPNKVKEINDDAFSNCFAITEVTLPASLKSRYGSIDAFSYCYGIKKLVNKSSENVNVNTLLRDDKEYFIDSQTGIRYDYYVSKGTFIKKHFSSPDKPKNLSVSYAKKGIKLTWKKDNGISGYYIYRSINSGKSKKIATVKNLYLYGYNKNPSYIDKAATGKGKKYTYKICAYTTIGKKTTKGKFTSKALYYLQAPSITSVKKNSAKSITVRWKGSSHYGGYEIQCSRSERFKDYKSFVVKSGKTNSKKISGLWSGRTLYVRIRSLKESSNLKSRSPWSKTVSVGK